MTSIAVNEMFGPTMQGEGPHAGEACAFLRLGGCNLHCVWCDTPYTWDWTGRNGTRYDPAVEVRKLDVSDVADRIGHLMGDARLVVVSGGEPMLQQDALAEFATALRRRFPNDRRVAVDVETNGTKLPRGPAIIDAVRLFCVSPKFESSGAGTRRQRAVDFAGWDPFLRAGRACIKFVAGDEADLRNVDRIVAVKRLPRRAVWIMPLGMTMEELDGTAQMVAAHTINHGYNYSPRLHVDVLGGGRGV